MKMRFLAIGAVASVLALAACAPSSRFEWGNYEHALYSYTQNPDKRDDYEATLIAAIERGKARNAVAPGLHAELGYLYLQQNNATLAVEHFTKERELFPEAAHFMDRLISKLSQGGQ